MVLDSVQVHEGFAKHQAYCAIAHTIEKSRLPILRDDLSQNRQRYWLLDRLCDEFIDPFDESAHVVAREFGYVAAKAVLNPDILSELVATSAPAEFWARLKQGGFAKSVEKRAFLGVETLRDLVTGNLSIKER